MVLYLISMLQLIWSHIYFQTSHTPREQLNSNINLIRADLNLPEDLEISVTNNSDDDKTTSDTDSIGSSLTLSLQVGIPN